MKSGKQHMAEGVEVPNEVVIRTLGEKETYKCLGILEGDTSKQAEMNEKFFFKVSKKNQKTTRDKILSQEPCQRDKYLGCPPRKILWTILEMEKRKNLNR